MNYDPKTHISKYSGDQGLCLWSLESQSFVLDSEGRKIPCDAKTGAPRVDMQKCPTCLGTGKVVKR